MLKYVLQITLDSIPKCTCNCIEGKIWHVYLYNYNPVSIISSVWMALFIQKYVKKNMTIKQLCLLRKREWGKTLWSCYRWWWESHATYYTVDGDQAAFYRLLRCEYNRKHFNNHLESCILKRLYNIVDFVYIFDQLAEVIQLLGFFFTKEVRTVQSHWKRNFGK